MSEFKCDFETHGNCNVEQETSDTDDWVRKTPGIIPPCGLPCSDATTGTISGNKSKTND